MIIRKHVPTEPGLTAAHAAMLAHGVDAFRDHAEEHRLFDITSISAHNLRHAVLPLIPDTPMGRAWTDAMTQALALTEADEYRSYDVVAFDDWERTVAGAINELADIVAAAPPLLEDVACAIRALASTGAATLGDIEERRRTVTEEGIRIRQGCTHHDPDGYEDEHDEQGVVVPWAHTEHLVDDLQQRVTRLLDAFCLETPASVPEATPGASRTPAAYALT